MERGARAEDGSHADDEVDGASGPDRPLGSDGGGYTNSADGGRQDIVDCGGSDSVRDMVVDANDTVTGCGGDTVDEV